MKRCNFKDISGQKFGRLTALYRLNNHNKNCVYWLCICDCGNLKEVRGTHLRYGQIKSCGCLNHVPTVIKHHQWNTRLYKIYHAIKQRCYNNNHTAYKNYGKRGITICDEWLRDFQAFYNWSISNGYKEGLTIDRIDVNGNYEPSNCRWATRKEQQNNRRNTIYLTYNNKTQSISQWADELGIKANTIRTRYFQGWNYKECLFGRYK